MEVRAYIYIRTFSAAELGPSQGCPGACELQHRRRRVEVVAGDLIPLSVQGQHQPFQPRAVGHVFFFLPKLTEELIGNGYIHAWLGKLEVAGSE
jgi:hypothetical protein